MATMSFHEIASGQVISIANRAEPATSPDRETSAPRKDPAKAEQGAAILSFPLSGALRLARLATDLRARFALLGLEEFSPFILKIDPVARTRLQIDPVTWIEFCEEKSGYRIVIDDEMRGPAVIETRDFGLIETLSRHYIFCCLAGILRGGDVA